MKKFNALLLSKDVLQISRFVDILKSNCSEVCICGEHTSPSVDISDLKPHIVFIDSLSVNNFSPLLKAIKNQVNLKRCPIIVITQDEISDDGVAALRDGASDYISYKVSDEEFYLRASHQLDHLRTETHDVIYQFDSVYPIEDRTILMECERYINNHMSDIHNVADLAIALHICERKLKDLFQEHTNLTAAGFIRERKISRAKELLSTTRMVMVDIAVELGYSNAANFATAFKHIEGITPSEYKLKSRSTPIF